MFLLAGLAGYGTQICMTYALKFAKAAPAIAMSYLSVVWGLLGGFFFFHEVRLNTHFSREGTQKGLALNSAKVFLCFICRVHVLIDCEPWRCHSQWPNTAAVAAIMLCCT